MCPSPRVVSTLRKTSCIVKSAKKPGRLEIQNQREYVVKRNLVWTSESLANIVWIFDSGTGYLHRTTFYKTSAHCPNYLSFTYLLSPKIKNKNYITAECTVVGTFWDNIVSNSESHDNIVSIFFIRGLGSLHRKHTTCSYITSSPLLTLLAS